MRGKVEWLPLPSLELLNELFHYDKKKGKIFHAKRRFGTTLGKEAGNENPKGYKRVKIYGKLYLVHRICFMMHNGFDPGYMEVDHIDGNPTNNMPENLRIAGHGQNQTNSGPYKSNKCGFRGVYFHGQSRKYRAAIQHEKKSKVIGGYDSPERAAREYDKKAIELFGVFAKTNFPLEDYIDGRHQ